MNKAFPFIFNTLFILILGSSAHAQMPMQFFGTGRALGRYTNQQMAVRPVSMQQYQDRQYPMQRTPPAQLPRADADLITSLEAELDQCRAAMLADAMGPVCSPDQRFALQVALARLVRARLHWSTEAYEQEMAFYLAEDARRQQAPTPPTPAK